MSLSKTTHLDTGDGAPPSGRGLGTPGKLPATARLISRKRDGNGVADGAEAAVDRAADSSGEPLPGALRSRFESSLGADLSGVRVHTGDESAQAAGALGARAYATGNDVHFAAGQYDPQSAFGVHLLAHEVAHTVQQQGGAAARQHKLEVSGPADSAEREADRAADAMVLGAPTSLGGAGAGLARKEGEPEAPANSTPAPASASTPADGAPTVDGAAAPAGDKPRYPKWKDQTISIPVAEKLGGNINFNYSDSPGLGLALSAESKVPLYSEKYSQGVQIAPGITGSLTGSISGSVGASLKGTPSAAWIKEPGQEEQSLQYGITGSGEVAFVATGSLQLSAGVGIANVLALEGGLKGSITAKIGGSASIAGTLTKKPDGSETGALDFKVDVGAELSAAASIVADVVIPGDRINVYEKALGKLIIGKATVGVHATYANGAVTHHPLVKTAEWLPVPPMEARAIRKLTEQERKERFPSELDAGASGADATGHPEEVAMTDQELFDSGKEMAVSRLGGVRGQVLQVSGASAGLGGMMSGSVMIDGNAVRGTIAVDPGQQAKDRAEGREITKVSHAAIGGWSTVGMPTVQLVENCAKTPDAVASAYMANHVELSLVDPVFEYRPVPPRMGTCKTDGSMGTTAEPEPPPAPPAQTELQNPGDAPGTCDPEQATCEDAGPRA